MARARCNGIELEYDAVGSPGDPPVLLIMGLGAQLIAWDDEFVLGLARRGHFVVRFDNRDVGLSTRFDGAPAPGIAVLLARRAAGEPLGVAYLSPTWPTTLRGCSTTWTSRALTWWARRWAA